MLVMFHGKKMSLQPFKFLMILMLSCYTAIAAGQALDLDPPEIVHTVPSTVKPGKDVQVLANITDNSGIEQATIYYRYRQIGPYQSLDMSNSAGAEYTATLATAKGQEMLQYYIEVVDTGGNRGLEGSPGTPLIVSIAKKSNTILYAVAGAVVIGLIAGAAGGGGGGEEPVRPDVREVTIGIEVPSQ